MRILVTGAGGFIGSHVSQRLLDNGHEVIGLDHQWRRQRQRLNGDELTDVDGRFERVDADMVTMDLGELLRDIDGVVHLAGSPGVQSSWANGFDHHVRNNVVSTQRLLEAALDAPVQRIVVASSSSVYGNIESGLADETHELRPLSPYGASKAAMEMLLGAYVERGLSVMPLRYFTVYGPRQRPDMAMHRMIEATRGGEPFGVRGDGTQERSYTFVGDVTDATVAALDSTSCLPINVGGADVASVNEVVALVERFSGTQVDRVSVASVPGDPQRTSADTARAREFLGFGRAVGLEEGLRRQVEWQLSFDPVVT